MANKKISDFTNKATPVDSDKYLIEDNSGNYFYSTFANIKSVLKTYFDTLYATTVSLTGYFNKSTDDTDDIIVGATNKFATAGEKTKLGFITVTQAVDLDTIESDTATNNAKVTNATHTGDVTGSGALTIDKTAITGKSTVTADVADYFLISDTSDAGNLKKALMSENPISIADMAAHSTGLKTGGVLTIGVGGAGVATSFTIALGTGMIVDNTVIPATLSQISWTAKVNVSVTNIATQPLTFIAIDSGGNVIQQATDFTDAQHRQYIVIGSVIHTNLSTVTAVNQAQHLAISPQSQINDLMQSLAGFNTSGNLFSANGANLNINKSAGLIFKQGSNYAVSANTPNATTTGALTAASFRYNNQTGAASGTLTAIDPNNYDNAGVTTAVPTNKFTIQRIFLFSSNLLAIQRGQTVYNSLAEAKAAIQTESFIVNSSISPNGILRAFLIVKEGTTALNSATDAFFLEAPKFGGTAGVGGLSVSTMQNAYDNSISPEIITDSTKGALSIKRGSASDTDNTFEVLNGSGSTVFSITGEGKIELGHVSDTTLSRSSSGVLAVEGVVIPSISSTNTLTNKRITSRVGTTASSATPTINTDDYDAYSITALAAAITSMTTNLSGTPTNFQKLMIRIKDDGTARAITWGASFQDGSVALPTTTILGKTLNVGLIYDSVDAKWTCEASGSRA